MASLPTKLPCPIINSSRSDLNHGVFDVLDPFKNIRSGTQQRNSLGTVQEQLKCSLHICSRTLVELRLSIKDKSSQGHCPISLKNFSVNVQTRFHLLIKFQIISLAVP